MKGGHPLALKRRQFTREFTRQVVREVEAGKPLVQLAREDQVHPTVVRRWQKEHQPSAERAFAGYGHTYKDEARMAELARLIGQLPMAHAVRKKALLRLEARQRGLPSTGGR
jgi:transposase-like protein